MSDRAKCLALIGEELAQVYKPDGMVIWLFSPNALLGGRTAAECIEAELFDDVLTVLGQLNSGAFT